MPPETLVELAFTSVVTGALGALVWTRLNRLEVGQDELRSSLAATREQMVTHADLDRLGGALRGEMRGEISLVREDLTGLRRELGGLREDLTGLRREMGGLREEMAVMRSDLTHVALAIGVNRPKPAEG